MRNFRKAALAGATAVAVAFGSTAVATAQGVVNEDDSSLSSKIGGNVLQVNTNPDEAYDGLYNVGGKVQKDGTVKGGVEARGDLENKQISKDKNANNWAEGYNIFGKDKNKFDDQPAWAKVLYGSSIFLAVSAFIGLIVGPAYNYLVHGPVNF